MRHNGRLKTWSLPHAMAIPVFALIFTAVAWRWGTSRIALVVYLAASVLTFIVYALDKSAAKAGRWRVAEKTLHLLALAGGWPGALIAQQVLRHKNRKPGFVAMFWVTVLVNVAVFVAWQSGIFPQTFGASLH